jgi:hypothetical protein
MQNTIDIEGRNDVTMNHFVQGVLTVEDEMYILEPDIRLASGETIHIVYLKKRSDAERRENEQDPLSLILDVDQWYELLLLVQLRSAGERNVTYAPTLPSGKKLDLVYSEALIYSEVVKRYDVQQGIILDLDWDMASQQYLAIAGRVLYTRRFVLVETAIGKMVLSYKALQDQLEDQIEQLAVGGYLEWGRSRLDLLAIIEKRDPRPGE